MTSPSPLAAAIATMPMNQARPQPQQEKHTAVVHGGAWQRFHTNSSYLVVVGLLAILVITVVLPRYWTSDSSPVVELKEGGQ